MRDTEAAPSITAFRDGIRSVIEREASAAHSRHVVVLGIDGIPYEAARRCWRHAETSKMRSVFPTTSSTAWLSALSGMSPADHGVPGVVFKVPDGGGELIHVYQYKGPLGDLQAGNVFTDAAGLGYVPVVLLGDLVDYDCAWRELLLRHALRVDGERLYTATGEGSAALDPMILCDRIRRTISHALGRYSGKGPCLLWCFIEMDRHLHYFGYDEHVSRFLELIERTAVDLTDRSAIVVAHSDHGLTHTIHETGIERLIERLKTRHGCSFGGAGRARWIYPRAGTEAELGEDLARALPADVRTAHVSDFFPEGSLSRGRVGEIVLLAEGEGFVTSPGYRLDHGSLTDAELAVPYSEWKP